jgi:hypothetical protein
MGHPPPVSVPALGGSGTVSAVDVGDRAMS